MNETTAKTKKRWEANTENKELKSMCEHMPFADLMLLYAFSEEAAEIKKAVECEAGARWKNYTDWFNRTSQKGELTTERFILKQIHGDCVLKVDQIGDILGKMLKDKKE